MIYRKSRRLAHRIIEGEGFVIDSRQQQLHHLNLVGAQIWQWIDGKRDAAALAKELAAHYEVDLKTADKDVEIFLKEMKTQGLLEEIPP